MEQGRRTEPGNRDEPAVPKASGKKKHASTRSLTRSSTPRKNRAVVGLTSRHQPWPIISSRRFFICPSAPASRCPRRRRALDDRATQRVRRVCCRRRLARPHASALVWHTPHRSPTSARRVGSAATPSCQRRAHGTCRSRRASTEGCNSLGVAFREPCSSRARHATGRPLRTSRPAFSRWAR